MPLIYVLTTDKTRRTYDEIFNALRRLAPNMNPRDAMLDFEKQAMLSVRTIFRDINIHGCFFHFAQNVWRHVRDVGLQAIYASDADFAFNIRLLISLAFVPPAHVEAAYDELIATDFFDEESEAEYKEEIQALLTYFQPTYVYGLNRAGVRRTPRFAISLWNVYGNTLQGKIFNIRFIAHIFLIFTNFKWLYFMNFRFTENQQSL